MVNQEGHGYIGQQIKGYTILHKLGGGGSAYVYLARNDHDDYVAIKLLDAKYVNSNLQQQILQEARFLQELSYHRHILPLIDCGESREGIPYIIVEYASGGTLREHINMSCQIQIEDAITILLQVSEALHAVHQHNIVHNDLKPENILFNRKNEAVLADFGIAIRLRANAEFYGCPRGTYAYMAPEQFDGIFTKESDQYALQRCT
jgi:serine/threonine protein kinase